MLVGSSVFFGCLGFVLGGLYVVVVLSFEYRFGRVEVVHLGLGFGVVVVFLVCVWWLGGGCFWSLRLVLVGSDCFWA